MCVVTRRCWYGNSRLIIGWGNVLTSLQISFKDPSTGNRIWYGEQGAAFRLDFWINGVSIYDEDHVTLLAYNKAVRHLRGGEATRRRYAQEKSRKSAECLQFPENTLY